MCSGSRHGLAMLGLMKCVAEAVAARGVKGLLEFVPGGHYLHDIAADALRRHRDRKAARALEADVKEMVAATTDAAFAAAKQAVEEAAPDLAPREKELLTQFVAGLPDAARQSLRRKDDPTGKTVPPGFSLRTAEDVARVLPQAPPRFAAGDPVPGLSSWRLERRLGGGGFGEVWLARHEWKDERRAVKFCTDPAARHRLVTHEKELIVRVMRHGGSHPNIVPLLECNLSGDCPWLMYEYVPGGTLADAVLDWRALPPAERVGKAVATLHELAAAVGHFHALDPAVVHRDLKPANVLMAGDAPRVTDFGIGGAAADLRIADETRAASRGVSLPTLLSGSYSLLYASPQQRSGEKPDPRDDIHALGVIAYQMLTGDLTAAPGRDMDDDLRDAGVPDGLIALIGRSVAQKAERRPKDAREWERAVEEWLPVADAFQSESRPAEPPPPAAPAPVVPTPPPTFPTPSPAATGEEITFRHALVSCLSILLGIAAAAIIPPGLWRLGENAGPPAALAYKIVAGVVGGALVIWLGWWGYSYAMQTEPEKGFWDHFSAAAVGSPALCAAVWAGVYHGLRYLLGP